MTPNPMKVTPASFTWLTLFILMAGLFLSACQPGPAPLAMAMPEEQTDGLPESAQGSAGQAAEGPLPTPLPTRPPFSPGELVDYTAQTGDTLPALAVRFNTTIDEILQANPFIPADATTMPPGMPMQIPIYYIPLWGSPYQILPDSLFINGPAQVGFEANAFVAERPGWLKSYAGFASGRNRSGAEIVELVARNYSVSPRLLLALLEHQSGALSQPDMPATAEVYPLGYRDARYRGLAQQLIWAANTLNNAYYEYRIGELRAITHQDGSLERPDPWQNAATIALQYYFSRLLPPAGYAEAIAPAGFAQTYAALFGNPWEPGEPHIPGSLTQPEFALPFEPGSTWALTGGPHTGWGTGAPLAALDFAPPSVVGGCAPTEEFANTVAPGVVVRSEPGIVVLDLDGDGQENTGWTVFYLHIGTEGRVPLGAVLQTGDPVGHPSCEVGRSTGTHIHIARKYNGEWIPAAGTLAFDMEGWVAFNGPIPYAGGMTRYSRSVTACVCSNAESFITAEAR